MADIPWWTLPPSAAIQASSFNGGEVARAAQQQQLANQSAAFQLQRMAPLLAQQQELANQTTAFQLQRMAPLLAQQQELANQRSALDNQSTGYTMPGKAFAGRNDVTRQRLMGLILEGRDPGQGSQWSNTSKTSGPAVPQNQEPGTAQQIGSPQWMVSGGLAPQGNQVGAPEGTYSSRDFQGLDSQNQTWVRQGAMSLGLRDGNGEPITANSSPSSVAAAVRNYQKSSLMAKRPVMPLSSNPDDISKWLVETQTYQQGAPTMLQGAVADLIKAGQGNQGQQIGQTQGKQDIKRFESAEHGRQNVARALGINPDNLGAAGSTEGTKLGQSLVSRGESYRSLRAQANEIASGLPRLMDPKNKGELDQQMVSVTRLVNKMAAASGTEGAMEMSLQESGVPKSLIDAHGVADAAKIWFTQNPAARVDWIKGLPDILFRNVMAPDYRAVGGDPDAWKRTLDAPKGLPTISGPSDPAFVALPKNAEFLGPDGKKRRKR